MFKLTPACTASPSVCSAPAVAVGAVTHTTASVVVTPPPTHPSGDWDGYELQVCHTDPAASCFARRCARIDASPALVACTLAELSPNTQYSVQVKRGAAVLAVGAAAAQTSACTGQLALHCVTLTPCGRAYRLSRSRMPSEAAHPPRLPASRPSAATQVRCRKAAAPSSAAVHG